MKKTILAMLVGLLGFVLYGCGEKVMQEDTSIKNPPSPTKGKSGGGTRMEPL